MTAQDDQKTDATILTAAIAQIVATRKLLDDLSYEGGTYHSIKYDIDGAHDLLLQAQMEVEEALGIVVRVPSG